MSTFFSCCSYGGGFGFYWAVYADAEASFPNLAYSLTDFLGAASTLDYFFADDEPPVRTLLFFALSPSYSYNLEETVDLLKFSYFSLILFMLS